jgi:wyosine [tRNA(Phe)-imidazoG37] synthetase (radical SAM superfamily)
MSTFLFDDIIFGPVRSRRLGASLGINLLPVNRKLCNFNCIYCECGFSAPESAASRLPAREEIRERLEMKLLEIKEVNGPLDMITFAGNGEPTLHPGFAGIIDDTISLRDRHATGIPIAVLSNGSRIDRPEIFQALGKIEKNILKLDSAFEETVRLINRPPVDYAIEKVIDGMIRYEGRFILQTLFLRGEFQGQEVDNATPEEIAAWLKVVERVKPSQVMIYTIARDTPVATLCKVPAGKLKAIARQVEQLGIAAQVSE